ncbi:MAG: hypothetical protein ABR545_01000 [Cyclonatronaceae bacterium]
MRHKTQDKRQRHGERNEAKRSVVEPHGPVAHGARCAQRHDVYLRFQSFSWDCIPPRPSTSAFDYSLLRRLALRPALWMTFDNLSLVARAEQSEAEVEARVGFLKSPRYG